MARHSYYRRHDWQTLRKYGGGQLSNWGSHCLDQLLCLVGEQEITDIFADLRQTVSAGDAEDHVKIVLRLSAGGVADHGEVWCSGTKISTGPSPKGRPCRGRRRASGGFSP